MEDVRSEACLIVFAEGCWFVPGHVPVQSFGSTRSEEERLELLNLHMNLYYKSFSFSG